MEDAIRLFRKQLFEAFFDWLEINKNAIGKWYSQLYNRGRDAEATCDTASNIMGITLWMFNMIGDCGVGAGIGPNRVNFQFVKNGIDKNSTMRLLHLMSSCLSLQYLPKDVIFKSIPIISAKRFSLKLYELEE